jgi:hypothetical protein
MAIDPSVLAELDNDFVGQVRVNNQGHAHAMERLRSSFDQLGHSVNAAISSVLIQASIPEQAMNNKLADRTPSPPAPPEPANTAK